MKQPPTPPSKDSAAKELARKKAARGGNSGSPGGSYRTSPQNTRANNAQTDRDLAGYSEAGNIVTDRNGRVISAYVVGTPTPRPRRNP